MHVTEFPWPHKLIDERMVKSVQRNYQGRHYQFVYFLQMMDGQKQVLKVANIRYGSGIENEMIRIRWVQGKIPAPTVINYLSNGEFEYLLTSYVQGCAGSDYYYQPGQHSLGWLLGKGLKALHSVPIHDCDFKDFAPARLIEMVKHNIEKRTEEAEQAAAEHFPGNTLSQLTDYLDQNCPSEAELVFTHGDYGSSNVLIDNGIISAFVDLGESGVSDPYYDIYYLIKSLTVYSNRKDELRDFLKGYGISSFDEKRLKFHQIIDVLLL